jgi:hypothetical protein
LYHLVRENEALEYIHPVAVEGQVECKKLRFGYQFGEQEELHSIVHHFLVSHFDASERNVQFDDGHQLRKKLLVKVEICGEVYVVEEVVTGNAGSTGRREDEAAVN